MLQYPLMKTAILMATLGSEPQVVTLTLDSLLQQREPIQRVVVIHTDPAQAPIAQALAVLHHEFEIAPTYRGKVIFDPALLTDEQGPLADVATAQQVGAAFESLYQLMRHHKRSGATLHLSIAGGRKTMAIFAFAAAQLLFDNADHIWHLDSDRALVESRRLHTLPNERVTLIEVPFTHWSPLPGAIRGEVLGDGAQQAISRQNQWQQGEKQRQAQAFLRALSPVERELVEVLVASGMSNKQLATHLDKSASTVANQLSAIYRLFGDHYHLANPDRSQLIAVLRGDL